VITHAQSLVAASNTPPQGLSYWKKEGSGMDIVLILHFTAGELAIKEYTSLDISRRENEIHVNITNDKGNFAFNSLYDKILELLGDDESFKIEIKQEAGGATFTDIAADYHLNNAAEVLHFGKVIRVQSEQETE